MNMLQQAKQIAAGVLNEPTKPSVKTGGLTERDLPTPIDGKQFRYRRRYAVVRCGHYDGRLGIQLVVGDWTPKVIAGRSARMLAGIKQKEPRQHDYEGEVLAMLTVSLMYDELQDGEVFIKTWGGNAPVVAAALTSGLFVDTGRRVPIGPYDAVAHVWRVIAP